MQQIGSQSRETLEESGYELFERLPHGEVILKKEGVFELWSRNNYFAGYVIEINGIGHEFIREVKRGEW